MARRTQRSDHRLLLMSCTALALCSAQAAFAQEAATNQLAEIIVTAQKRSQNIQDVPAAVTALTPELLADTHSTQLTDIAAYVPALQVNTGGTPGQTAIAIRGIAQIGPGPTVATYVGDTPVGSSSAYGAAAIFAIDLLPYDIERIEVLRGPQGTLYGASSMGGLLKYVLTEPSLDRFQARVGGDLFDTASASKTGGGLQATLSGPLVKGVLGATASVAVQKTPGYIDNSVTGEKDQNDVRQESARLGLLWRPTDDLSVKLDGLYQHIDADGFGLVAVDPATMRPIAGRRENNNLTAEAFGKKVKIVSASVDYSLPWATLVSVTSYQDVKTDQTRDTSYVYGIVPALLGLPPGLSSNQYKLGLKKFTQEVRLQSNPGTIEWLAGVFYTDEDSSNYQRPDLTDTNRVPIAGIDPFFTAQLPSTYKEYAGFGDLTWHVNDRFELTGGVRRSHNSQSFSEIANSAVLGLTINLLDQKSKESVTTYSAAGKYHFNDDVMGYVRVSSGYQPGGPNLAVAGINPTFASNSLTNYEAGVKSEFLDRRVLLDVAAFYIDWKDIQMTVPAGNGVSAVDNAGTARSQGFEANASIRPADRLQIDGSFAYVDAELTEDAPEIEGLKGDRLPDIPRYSGSVRISYTKPLQGDWSANFGAGLRMQSNRFSAVNSAALSAKLPSYGALDLNASITNDRYTVRLYAKNVTDKHAFVNYDPVTDGVTGGLVKYNAAVLQPRLIGLSVEAKF